jgi:hypothetical protein
VIFKTSLILLLFFLASCSNDTPLTFDLPQNWVVDYNKLVKLDFHTFSVKDSNESVLMLSRWPPSTTAKEIPILVRELAESFASTAKDNPELGSINVDYKFDGFKNENCSGSYAVFEFEEDSNRYVQTMFMLDVEGDAWNGQFTGSFERWELALQILQSIKRLS